MRSRHPSQNLRHLRMGPPGGAARRRLVALWGLAARPELAPRHARALARTLNHDQWRPVPRLPMLQTLEPLLIHHLLGLGFSPGDALDLSDHGLPPPIPFHDLATAYYRRRKVVRQLFAALRRDGVDRAMVIKGAALAPLQPSPALRDMCDADIVILREARALAEETMIQERWTRSGGVWTHPSGVLVDLQSPSGPYSHQMWDRAVPHPEYEAFYPEDSDHVAIVALHAARSGGVRIWRDLCDLNFLLQNGEAPDIAQEALRRASTPFSRVSLCSVFRLMNEVCRPIHRLPGTPGGGWTHQEEVACLLHFQVYRQLLVDRISPVALDLMATLTQSPGQAVRRILRAISRSGSPGTPAGGPIPAPEAKERDPVMGDLPSAGSLRRQLLKTRLLARALLNGQFMRYWRLNRRRNEIRTVPKTFGPD